VPGLFGSKVGVVATVVDSVASTVAILVVGSLAVAASVAVASVVVVVALLQALNTTRVNTRDRTMKILDLFLMIHSQLSLLFDHSLQGS
jgi:hypothetical protein